MDKFISKNNKFKDYIMSINPQRLEHLNSKFKINIIAFLKVN